MIVRMTYTWSAEHQLYVSPHPELSHLKATLPDFFHRWTDMAPGATFDLVLSNEEPDDGDAWATYPGIHKDEEYPRILWGGDDPQDGKHYFGDAAWWKDLPESFLDSPCWLWVEVDA